jgi:hypothetical protein
MEHVSLAAIFTAAKESALPCVRVCVREMSVHTCVQTDQGRSDATPDGGALAQWNVRGDIVQMQQMHGVRKRTCVSRVGPKDDLDGVAAMTNILP